MKKFFMNTPLQKKEKFKSYIYEAVDNSKLQLNKEISFPILTAIAGHTEKGEEIEVYSVLPQDNQDAKINFDILDEQIKALSIEKNICYKLIPVYADTGSDIANNIDIFQKLIDHIEDNDELFGCITYGTKPNSNALSMALQYGYRVLENVSISCIVYGQVNRFDAQDSAKVYDMTAMIKIDEMVNLLASRKVKNPKETLKAVLSL